MGVTSPVVGAANASVLSLEQHVNDKIKRLGLISRFLHDLQSVEDKYAQECTKLACTVPGKREKQLERLPELHRVCAGLEEFVKAHNDAKAMLAKDLARTATAPMDSFLDQQTRQTKRMLAEISEAAKKEQDLDAQCRHIRECLVSGGNRATTNDTDGRSLSATCNQDFESEGERSGIKGCYNAAETKALRAHRAKQQKQLLELHNRRKSERGNIRERLDELHLAEQQQVAVMNGIVERIITAYNRLIIQSNSLIADLQMQLSAEKQASKNRTDSAEDAKSQDGGEDSRWVLFLEKYDYHVEMTSWMDSFFTQVFPVEENMLKRLQAVLKLHPNTQVFTATRISEAGSATSSKDGSSATIVSDLMHFHKLLTVNLMDPISRTLKFSKQKQEKIRQELLQSLEETTKLVQYTRKKLKEKEAKALKLLVSSRVGRQLPPSESSLSGSASDAMKLNLSNFGLRSAVASLSKVQSPTGKQRNSLTNIELEGRDGGGRVATTVERSGLEKDVEDSRAYLISLERNETEQRREIMQTLQNTSLLSVKTMELMVNDYLKHLSKALATIQACIAKYDTLRVAAIDGANVNNLAPFPPDRLSSSRASWTSLVSFLHDDDAEDPLEGIEKEGDDEDENSPEQEQDGSNQEDICVGGLSSGAKTDQHRTVESSAFGKRDVFQRVSSSYPRIGRAAQVCDLRAFAKKEDMDKVLSSIRLTFKSYMAPLVAAIFRNEESTLVVFAACMATMSLMALYIWFCLARLSQSWQEIAALQRASSQDFQEMLELMQQARSLVEGSQ